MRRLLLSLLIALVATTAAASSATAQPAPDFQMGFKTLVDLIPDVVGQPLENERYNPMTGESRQFTTNGLLVWDKATNRTTFTDGATTWVLGPFGLQTRPNDERFDWELAPHPIPLSDGGTALDVGTTAPLDISPSLVGPLQTLRTVDGGDWLARVAAENDITVRSAPTSPNVLGLFLPQQGLAVIASRLNAQSEEVRAAVLAHELQHAADTAAGNLPTTPTQCIQFEARAFEREAIVWNELWQGNLPPATSPFIAELNDITTTIATDPDAFVMELVRRYGADCGLIQ